MHYNILTLCFLGLLLSCQALTSSVEEDTNSDFVHRKYCKKEKLSHFKFYWHDISGEPNPTSVEVVPPANKSDTNMFGLVKRFDNPMTVSPNLSSKLVGRSQGFYAASGQGEFSLLMAMNLAFTQGKYNGSTITILGRNAIFNKVREMPVVGGSGLFRFARGYAEARTTSFDVKTGYALIQFNVYVSHY